MATVVSDIVPCGRNGGFDKLMNYMCHKALTVSDIPDLKDLAKKIVDAYGILIKSSRQTTEQLESCCSSVKSDCPVLETSSDLSPLLKNCVNTHRTVCVNKIGDFGEKLPGRPFTDLSRIMQKDMKVEKNRLETFNNVWPLSYVDPSDLAAVGFFYLQSGDKVQCAFCKGIIVDWAPGDDPLAEHSLHFPLCPFLMKRDVGNVPISRKNFITDQDSNSYPERLGLFRRSNSQFASANPISLPKFPKMESKDKRLFTFHSWHYDAVKADDLAEAGFFSTGTSDIVACFSCGGTLGHWDSGDDPWLEHKKHFPQCAYLKSANHSTVKSICNGFQVKECISNLASVSQLPDVDELMETDVCVEATKIFPETVVREALERQLKQKGQGFQNIEDLCSTILEIQDESQKTNGVESQIKNEGITSTASGQHMCKICYDKEMGVVFLPCGHMMACPECALSVTVCPLCRKGIESSVRAYIG